MTNAPQILPVPQPTGDDAPKPLRLPKVRLSYHLHVPKDAGKNDAMITVTEQREKLIITLKSPEGIERSVQISLLEAAALCEHINLIRRRIITRKPYRP